MTTNNSESESQASEYVQGSGQNNDERIQIQKKTDAAELLSYAMQADIM